MVYLGPSETHRRRAHGQTFTLVVPEQATLTASPEAILDSLAAAADGLRVGDRDDSVTVFAAPTASVEWGVRGLQYGEADMWVRDFERLSTADNTWLHEYVHSRQEFRTTTRTAWTREATATYYAALLTLEQDRIDFGAFRARLFAGTRQPQADAVLARPSTWGNAAQYHKGALVVGDVDRRIRLASNGTRSFQSVLAAMNAAEGTVDEETFLGTVADVSNRTVGRTAERFTTTGDTPDVWGTAAHGEAFGVAPARISLVFAVDGREAATERTTLAPGETRNVTFSHAFADAGRQRLSFGDETVTVTISRPARASVTAASVNRTRLPGPGAVELAATVANDESIPAETTVAFRRNGERVARRTVALAPGERRVVAVTVRLADPGEYALRAGPDAPITVTVAPGTATPDPDPGAGGNGDAPTTGGGDDTATAARDDATPVADAGTTVDRPTSGFGPGPGVASTLFAALLALAALRARD
jgi:hypothetical protein